MIMNNKQKTGDLAYNLPAFAVVLFLFLYLLDLLIFFVSGVSPIFDLLETKDEL